jgi:hypothetical protein
VSGAPEKHVPGLWRVDFPGWTAPMLIFSPATACNAADAVLVTGITQKAQHTSGRNLEQNHHCH